MELYVLVIGGLGIILPGQGHVLISLLATGQLLSMHLRLATLRFTIFSDALGSKIIFRIHTSGVKYLVVGEQNRKRGLVLCLSGRNIA